MRAIERRHASTPADIRGERTPRSDVRAQARRHDGAGVLASWRLVPVLVGALLLTATHAHAIPGGEDGNALRGAANALHELRVEDAARTIDRLARAHGDDPDVRFERAMLRFYRGDYAGAVVDLDAAGDRGRLRSDDDRRGLASLIRATHEATRNFVTVRSENGRYVVRHAPGPDAVLVPYAFEAMEAADRTIGAELGVRVPGPLRLEIYPTAASLAQVSTLTVREIETTGTIALCKWDRLMVTSPRALVRGYPWMDTIGHELVHLFLSRSSRDRAPVWLQEGVAKFLERRWRGERAAAHLDPAADALLHAAVQSDRLLPFDRLHPSIARLPSQDDAALAFAQVATFIEMFYREHGADGLRRAIAEIAAGDDAREALAEVADVSWNELERSWKRALRDRPAPAGEAPRSLGLRLRQGEGEVDETSEVTIEGARRFLRLGDLLWDRERPRAAALEYARAHEAAPDDPIVASRYARAALAGGQPERAVQALARFRERYPEHAPTWAISGSAWLALGDVAHAREALREAIRINPFDPQPHCDLAQAAEDDAERGREQTSCSMLGGSPRSR
jgi:tetratricopeptide (TPR) repeat protein